MPLPKRKLRTIPKVRRQYVTIPRPAEGLNVDDQSTMISDKQSPDCHEMVFEDGSFKKAYGWVAFGYSDVAVALISRLTVHKSSTKALLGRTTVLKAISKNLVCRVTKVAP